MTFARTAAVAGTGTVSCTGTTTVTGSGTAFAFAIGGAPSTSQPRVGGTITVGGVTKTITAIASATSLTVDTAFGTFSGQAFTTQTGITQTGTDTLTNASAAPTGFTIKEDRGGLMRLFDVGGQDLFVDGVITVQSWGAQLRNDGSCSNRFQVNGSASGGEVIINGRKATANNGPYPYPGFDWQGQNGQKVMQLRSTNATYPAKFTIIDACVRYGADWLTTDSGNFSRITTQGDVCWILCARGTGTSQARLRQDNTTASIDFQATKTYVGLWLNFGVPQISLKGYTPIDTDGPEINLASVPTASRITIENYLTTYVAAAYYAGVQIVLLGSAWTRLKNNLLGTNISWRSSSSSGGRHNVLEFSKQITIRVQDTAGNLLSDGFMYYQPVGSNVAGVRAKGITSDITFDLAQQAIATVGGAATSEFVFAWGFTTATTNLSSYSYFCTGTTRGAETHVIRSSRYGYDKQSTPVSLAGNNDATPTFVHVSLPTTDKVIANAAAISGVSFNFTTKVMTVTGALTIQQIYDAYQYQLNQTANLQQPDECTVANGQTYYVGWTINNSGTINEGADLTTIRAATITNTGAGAITAIYTSSAGTSTNLELRNVKDGAAYIAAYNSTKNTILFGTNATGTAQTYTVRFPPGSTGTAIYVARQGYGDQFEFEVITLLAGSMSYTFTDIPDEGISEASLATVNGYTTIETTNKLYDRIAAFRMTEPGIKLGNIVVRAGTQLQFGGFSGVVHQSAAAVFNIVGSTITLKANALAGTTKYDTIIATPPATWTPNTTEELNVEIEDANGDSSVNIQASGISTFEVWKITDATDPDDYDTGVLLATVPIGKFRFIGVNGYKMVIRDTITNFRVVVEMEKGIYEAALFFGAAVQLAQAAEVSEINNKVDSMQLDVTNMPASVWAFIVETGHSALATMRLMASVLVGKVSGAGTGTETFRDMGDTKNRVISSVDENGNRTAVTKDGT
jgi:hypothetical protein